MKKNLVSILITNYNKSKYLKKSIKSCQKQTYRNIEIILFDDLSTDASYKILKNLNTKKLSIMYNKKKKFTSGPLNQLHGIKTIFKKSRGKIIFLLDSDDFFLKNKIDYISQKFENYKYISFIQDTPYSSNQKIKLKKKDHSVSIWPSFYPTSCITVRRNFFKKFLNLSESNRFPNLEIDARLCIYAFLKKEFKITKKPLTVYNYDSLGISSSYRKFSINWWKKRNEAYDYMKILMKKMKIEFKPSIDFYVTKIFNIFI